MNSDEEDILLTRIRCLRHCERPSLNMYDMWIRMHRRNTITGAVECTVMHGLVVTGIRTTRDRPFAYPIWGSNGHPGNRIQWDAHTRQIGGVQSLSGQYITTITHNLHNPIQGEQVQIGLFTLAQVRD